MREQQQSRQDQPSAASLTGIGAAQLQSYLRGLDYPADKRQLLEQARQEEAPTEVLDLIEQFPEQQYNSAVHVSQMLDRLHH